MTKTHKCSKETEIALIQQEMENNKKLLVDIHKNIVGNGKPGMKEDIKEIKIKQTLDNEMLKKHDTILTQLNLQMAKYAGAVGVIVFIASLFAQYLI